MDTQNWIEQVSNMHKIISHSIQTIFSVLIHTKEGCDGAPNEDEKMQHNKLC